MMSQDHRLVPASITDPGQLAVQPVDSVTLGNVLATVWRRKLLIIGTVVTVTSLAMVVILLLTPRYTAEALVVIQSRGLNITDLESVVPGMPTGDDSVIETEVQVLRSHMLINQVIDGLGLTNDPEFNPALRPVSALGALRERLYAWWRDVAPSTDAADTTAPIDAHWAYLHMYGDGAASPEKSKERTQVISVFDEKLAVAKKLRSRVISVRFTSQSPETAAVIANTLVERYINDQVEMKFSSTQQASAWLNDRIPALQEKVAQAEASIEQFRKDSGLLGTGGVTLTSQQTSQLNTQLILARTNRAEANARLRQVEKLLNAGGVDSVAEVLESDLIQRLREQEAVLQRRVAELSQEYGERHPKMINLRAEAEDLNARIQSEVSKVIEGIRNEVAIARTREETLLASLNQLKEQTATANESEVQLRALEREAEVNRALLANLLSRQKETSLQADANSQRPDARILSRAGVPAEPSYPKKLPMLALVIVASGILGIMLVFFVESLDRGYRSYEQIVGSTGLPVLSMVPKLGWLSSFRHKPARFVLDHPSSTLGESMRTLQSHLRLARNKGAKSVLVTSSSPKEGKTAIVVCLARVLASAGHKVVIVDGDLRRPSVHSELQLSRSPGLGELLSGENEIQEAVQIDEASGVHVVAAGAAIASPPDMLDSAAMDKLLGELSQSYDAIIFDSPPNRAVTDADILSRKVDTTVFAIRWATTRREVANLGLDQVTTNAKHVAGVLLSMVDVRKHARYAYADSGIYVGQLKKYYMG